MNKELIEAQLVFEKTKKSLLLKEVMPSNDIKTEHYICELTVKIDSKF